MPTASKMAGASKISNFKIPMPWIAYSPGLWHRKFQKIKIPMPRRPDIKGIWHRKLQKSKSRCFKGFISRVYGIENPQIQNSDALKAWYQGDMASEISKLKIPMPKMAHSPGLWHRKFRNSKSRCSKGLISVTYGIGNSKIQNLDALKALFQGVMLKFYNA